MYALRDGDVQKLTLVQAHLLTSQPPDPNQLIAQYSQTQAHLVWNSITVMGTYNEPDSTEESFVSVDYTAPGPGGGDKGVMIWHFTTVPSAQGTLIFVDLVTNHPYLQ